MMKAIVAVLPMLAAGCTTMAEPPAPAGPCALSEPLRIRYAGVKYQEKMRPAIERTAHAGMSRILRPGDAATMDFRPERLTILLDDGGLIDGFRCG